MREHGVAVNGTPKRHGGLQNTVMDDQVIPLTFNRGILKVPIREPTNEDLLQWAIVDLTADGPWDPSTLNDEDFNPNCFRWDSTHHSHVTKLVKIIGTEEKVDLQALVTTVQSACRLETHFPGLNDAELEKLHPYLGWKPLELVKKSWGNTPN